MTLIDAEAVVIAVLIDLIFYAVGGILIVAAGVLLITKKRMSE